jgi:hypothetical protein
MENVGEELWKGFAPISGTEEFLGLGNFSQGLRRDVEWVGRKRANHASYTRSVWRAGLVPRYWGRIGRNLDRL